jgi:pimeloyl-ACP methyl ester carboxylesterase/predicted Ser/Thr protein kinase
MGEVYRARDTRLDREVALKFLTRVGRLIPEHAARLRAEAKSLAALNHPNIVTIYDIDEEGGVPFLVLEWLSGGTLSDPSQAKPFRLERFLEVASPVAEALSAAHKRGIVHRDVKPGNVLVSGDGHIKLVDFGLAKFRQSDSNLTRTATTLGTVAYMSPEQASGSEVQPASDVFSFGVMAYELLTGQLPFEGQHPAAVIYSIIHKPHVPLQSRRSDLPSGLAALIERCLKKDPRERFDSGAELAEELRTTWAGEASGDAVDLEVTTNAHDRFCTTVDGARIAYSVLGGGPLLVRVLGWFTHLEIEWEWPEMRSFWESLAETHTVVRYDGRGIGLSDPYSGAFTEETRRLDLEAVLDAVGAERAALLGISEGGWTAAHYAVTHPQRVSHLILFGAYRRGARARPGYDPEEEQALRTLIRKGWGRDTPMFRQIFTSQFFPGDVDLRVTAHFDEMQRTSADPETAARYMESCDSRGDGRNFLAQVRVPTLVVHSRDDHVVNFEEGRLLAAIIPGAQLLPLPSNTHFAGASQKVLAKVAEAIDRHTGVRAQRRGRSESGSG